MQWECSEAHLDSLKNPVVPQLRSGGAPCFHGKISWFCRRSGVSESMKMFWYLLSLHRKTFCFYRNIYVPGPRWHGGAMGKAFRLAISRSRVQILLEATLRNNLRQVVYTYVPLSPRSITWYRPKGGDALQLGR